MPRWGWSWLQVTRYFTQVMQLGGMGSYSFSLEEGGRAVGLCWGGLRVGRANRGRHFLVEEQSERETTLVTLHTLCSASSPKQALTWTGCFASSSALWSLSLPLPNIYVFLLLAGPTSSDFPQISRTSLLLEGA